MGSHSSDGGENSWVRGGVSLDSKAVMHVRASKVTTTYPFLCMIFCSCRSTSVPICHIDQLKTLLVTIYIGLIRDEGNELSPCRGPRT